jgi:hypothetical protein
MVRRIQGRESVQDTSIGGKKIKIARAKGIFQFVGSLSFDRQTMKAGMIPCSQGERGTSPDGGGFRAEMRCSARPTMPCEQSARRKAGGCMRISANNQDVSEHCMNKVVSVEPQE